jgi:hypothetical protein
VELFGRLDEHLTGCIGGFRLIPDLRANLSFEHVHNGDTRMAVCRRTLARPIRNFYGSNRLILECEIGQVVFKNNFIGGLAPLRIESLKQKEVGSATDESSASFHKYLSKTSCIYVPVCSQSKLLVVSLQ